MHIAATRIHLFSKRKQETRRRCSNKMLANSTPEHHMMINQLNCDEK
jgi:hypothetical protein